MLGKSRTTIICMDKAEWHLPERCLRQFELRQSIPPDVQRRESKSNELDTEIESSKKLDLELQEWSNRHQNIVGGLDGGEDVDETKYTQWYSKITRKKLHRQAFVPSQFQESVRILFSFLLFNPF